MQHYQRCDAALLARFFLCAALAVVVSGCGGDGESTNPYTALVNDLDRHRLDLQLSAVYCE